MAEDVATVDRRRIPTAERAEATLRKAIADGSLRQLAGAIGGCRIAAAGTDTLREAEEALEAARALAAEQRGGGAAGPRPIDRIFEILEDFC